MITEALNEKKLSLQEKVKVAKPGLAILEELEALAAEAKAKGGAQVRLLAPYFQELLAVFMWFDVLLFLLLQNHLSWFCGIDA